MDGAGGCDCLAIARTLDAAEATLSFLKHENALTISGEQHEVGFPMPGRRSAFGLGGPFAYRTAMFDEAGGTAAAAFAVSYRPKLVTAGIGKAAYRGGA